MSLFRFDDEGYEIPESDYYLTDEEVQPDEEYDREADYWKWSDRL